MLTSFAFSKTTGKYILYYTFKKGLVQDLLRAKTLDHDTRYPDTIRQVLGELAREFFTAGRFSVFV